MLFLIIPVHNRRDVTRACLSHIQNLNLTNINIVIVDDGSTDGTGEMISNDFPSVTVLSGDGNLWWTGAIALGMEYAYNNGANYFLWLNDDCLMEPNSIAKMLSLGNLHPSSIISPAIFYTDSTHPAETGFTIGKCNQVDNDSNLRQVHGVSGFCVLIPRCVYESIGVPDYTRFPHYGGDCMYTLRAHRAGFNVYIAKDATATLADITPDRYGFSKFTERKSSLYSSIKKMLFSIKSPYNMKTRYHYFTYKYGITIGIGCFIVKYFVWLAALVTYRMHLKVIKD